MPKMHSTVEITPDAPGATPEEMKTLEKHYHDAFPGLVKAAESAANSDHVGKGGSTPFTLSATLAHVRHAA